MKLKECSDETWAFSETPHTNSYEKLGLLQWSSRNSFSFSSVGLNFYFSKNMNPAFTFNFCWLINTWCK